MNDTFVRTIRTFFQTFLGTLITSGALSVAGPLNLNALETAGESALAAAVVASLTFLHNWLEDTGKVIDTK